MSTALQSISSKVSERFGMGSNTTEVLEILKATAFKSPNGVTDAQMTALMVVADQYGLNPFTKEIFAFPDKGSIVPVVSVDGWSRIINEHPQFDGLEFVDDSESCTCVIYRKDRGHAIKITEYLSECRKEKSPAWMSHPKRMLRHKSLIQCARLAFGFVGIYDQDEAERIVEIDVTPPSSTKKEQKEQKELELCSDQKFIENSSKWEAIVASGKKTADDLIAFISTKAELTEDQKQEIRSWETEHENS